MKIKKFKYNTNQLLQLHIIKTKIYEKKLKKNSLDSLSEIAVSDILVNLKKSLQVIFQFHKRKKKILFIGFPEILEQKINFETKHTAIPKFFSTNGLFLNPSVKKSLEKYSYSSESNKIVSLLKLGEKPSLIVLFNSNNNENILKECYYSKIPVIKFNTDFLEKFKLHSYAVPGYIDTNKKTVNTLFFKIINSILKK